MLDQDVVVGRRTAQPVVLQDGLPALHGQAGELERAHMWRLSLQPRQLQRPLAACQEQAAAVAALSDRLDELPVVSIAGPRAPGPLVGLEDAFEVVEDEQAALRAQLVQQ